MVFLQIAFGLNIWWVIVIGVIGSVVGRYALTLYIPFLADRIFRKSKNEDVQFLGDQMKEKGWKGQVAILAYTLLPLPTTPLFLASGMAKINTAYIMPVFFVGKFKRCYYCAYWKIRFGKRRKCNFWRIFLEVCFNFGFGADFSVRHFIY